MTNPGVKPQTSPSADLTGYGWAAGGVAGATLLFWLARGYLDKEHASLLYLPVVIACATRFGQGPATLGAVGSFFCWNYFFLPPYHTWRIENPKDWLALIVFLVTALATARLAAQAREQARQAGARERETQVLLEASRHISVQVDATHVLPILARELVVACRAGYCAIYRAAQPGSESLTLAAFVTAFPVTELADPPVGYREEGLTMAQKAHRRKVPIGFASGPDYPDDIRHRRLGAFVPLLADGESWGVVHVGPRQDRHLFSPAQERLILALANHAAVALARQSLAAEAAQAEALREADHLKNTLLSLVSHELRTPLAAIKASAGGLLQANAVWSTEALADSLSVIDGEADRLTALVSKLLDLSRLEAGAWRPDLDWCDLLDVLGIALSRLPEAASRRVCVDSAPDLPLVRADAEQVAQVMTNLLENALKYSPPDTKVQVTLRATAAQVCAEVADRGAGIPTGEAEAIFERFYRLPAHRQAGPPGTGLGLAICRGILEAHGGRITANNRAGGGAAFSFTLPRPDPRRKASADGE